MNNFNIARDRIGELQASANRERQVNEAKKGGEKLASHKSFFGLFARRTDRPVRLSAERRAELIQQEWKA